MASAQETIATIKAQIVILEQQVDVMQATITTQAATIAARNAEIVILKARIAELEGGNPPGNSPAPIPPPSTIPPGAIVVTPSDAAAKISAAVAGATIWFTAGTYRGLSIAPKTGQKFIGAAGAILNGSAVLTSWSQSGNLWSIGGQTQRGRVHPAADYEPGTMRPGDPNSVFYDNKPLKPVDALSKVASGTFFIDYGTSVLYIADNPSGHTVEATKTTDAFHGTATNVTIKYLVVEKFGNQLQDGAILGGAGWIVDGCEVRLNYAVGITVHGSGGQIINCYVHDNGEMGLGGGSFSGATMAFGILVQGNEIVRNGFWSNVNPLWEGGGFKFANTDGLIVRGNRAIGNKGSGLWTDINNIRTLYENNVATGNTINGLSHEISYDAIIRNNTFWGNGAGDTRGWVWGADLNIQNSLNCDIWGNRIEMTGGGNGLILVQQNRGSGNRGVYATTGNKIHDNIIIDHDAKGIIGGAADYNPAGMFNGSNTWTNNKYYMADTARFAWNGTGKNFAAFKSASGETGSISQTYPDTSGWPK